MAAKHGYSEVVNGWGDTAVRGRSTWPLKKDMWSGPHVLLRATHTHPLLSWLGRLGRTDVANRSQVTRHPYSTYLLCWGRTIGLCAYLPEHLGQPWPDALARRCYCCLPKALRLLVDAGADATAASAPWWTEGTKRYFPGSLYCPIRTRKAGRHGAKK